MKVFISWSGQFSKPIALLLKHWIGDVIQGVEAWVSDTDLEKGTVWFGEIGSVLSSIDHGIVILTPDSLKEPWILFEAGALYKGLAKGRLWTVLVNLEPVDISPPLSQFNATIPRKEDMFKMVNSINLSLGSSALSEEKLRRSFDRCWADFDSSLSKLVNSEGGTERPAKRTMHDVAEELLSLARATHSRLSTLDRRVRQSDSVIASLKRKYFQEKGKSIPNSRIQHEQEMVERLNNSREQGDLAPLRSLAELVRIVGIGAFVDPLNPPEGWHDFYDEYVMHLEPKLLSADTGLPLDWLIARRYALRGA